MNPFKSNYWTYIKEAELELKNQFSKMDSIREYNQAKILEAMQSVKLSHADFHWNTGYGYGDAGREKVETIYAKIFNAEDALVRPSIASGTHALSLVLDALLLPGDKMLSLSDKPYDTLQKVIGITGSEPGNLMEKGVLYADIPLSNGQINIEAINSKLLENIKLVLIQRSMGYTDRAALSISNIKEAIEKVKMLDPNIIVMVDNCYGEFTSYEEPSDIGADITVGSLIKNPGGGIALSGGYLVGKSHLIERCANKLTAPGLGKDCGLTFGTTRTTLQGLFLAPIVVNNAVKAATLFGYVFKKLGYSIVPEIEQERSDIVQGIIFNDPDKVITFCQAIQKAAAVDSHVTPYPWSMPGYEDEVIMAAGGFIEGSSIEISADGPLREPYIAFYQGGLSYDQCKFALINVLEDFKSKDFI